MLKTSKHTFGLLSFVQLPSSFSPLTTVQHDRKYYTLKEFSAACPLTKQDIRFRRKYHDEITLNDCSRQRKNRIVTPEASTIFLRSNYSIAKKNIVNKYNYQLLHTSASSRTRSIFQNQQQQQQQQSVQKLKTRTRLGLRKRGFNSSLTLKERRKEEIKKPVEEPTFKQLKHKAFSAALPMVGFGFMDNLVMIQAGELIDTTVGVAFGLSTLSAAAIGQIFSDVSGVCFGGTVDAIASKLGVRPSNLTPRQQRLPKVKAVTTFGSAVGVIVGCLLGMSCLLFMDTDKAARLKRRKQLNAIFETVMSEGHKTLGADRCTLFLYDRDNEKLWSKYALGESELLISMDSVAGQTVKTKDITIISDAYQNEYFDGLIDKRTGYRTKSMLSGPVLREDGEVLGVIQMLNKTDDDGNIISFSDEDITILQMLCSHVSLFLKHFASED